VTVLVYLPYLPRTPALLFFFCLVPFGGATPRCQFCLVVLEIPAATLQLFVISFVTLCIYQLHHPQPRSISLSITLAHFDHLSDGQSFSQSPSSNCVHYKVYFILHFIMYTFYFLLFFTYVLMILVKSPPPVSAYFFGSSSLSEHIITLFVRAFHQHLFICIHFLFFFLSRICYWYSRVT
jgi:hypothetical protein